MQKNTSEGHYFYFIRSCVAEAHPDIWIFITLN